MQGVEGFTKYDFFASEYAEPRNPNAKKEMVATMLWLGYPSDGAALQSTYGVSSQRARSDTESDIWYLSGGSSLSSLGWWGPYVEMMGRVDPNYYNTDLEYYSANSNSPYYGQWGHQGSLVLSGDTAFTEQSDGTFRTGTITVGGTYAPLGTSAAHFAGTFEIDVPSGIQMYSIDSNGNESCLGTGRLTVPAQGSFYFTSNQSVTSIEVTYTYQVTKGVYLLHTDTRPEYGSTPYQNFVSIETKPMSGSLTLGTETPQGYELPETGGAGTGLCTWTGTALILLSLIYGYCLRYKREGGEFAIILPARY